MIVNQHETNLDGRKGDLMAQLYADDKLIDEQPDCITIPANKINIGITTLPSHACIFADTIKPKIHMMPEFKHITNCRNCGAPLNSHKDCEYCGTKYQMKSGVYMDATSIGFFVG